MLTGHNADVIAAVTPGGIGGFRGRVEQQVDAITGSANRVLSGVVDSGFGVLRSLLPVAGTTDGTSAVEDGDEGLVASAPWNVARPGFGLLRRESGFSIASLAASLPGASGMRERARSFASAHSAVAAGEEGQEMVESRPGSVKNMLLREESEEEGEEGGRESSESAGEGESEEGEEELEEARHDTRSIRSFESMMSRRSRNSRHQHASQSKVDNQKKERLSLTDRLASMSRLTKGASANAAHGHSQEPSAQSTHRVRLAPHQSVSYLPSLTFWSRSRLCARQV